VVVAAAVVEVTVEEVDMAVVAEVAHIRRITQSKTIPRTTPSVRVMLLLQRL
jgi:hypothetical protein